MSDLKATVTQEQLANLMIDQEARFKVMVQETLMAMIAYPQSQQQPPRQGETSPLSWSLPSANEADAAMDEK